MTTLDDKILGYKAQNYVSSSESENDDEDDDDRHPSSNRPGEEGSTESQFTAVGAKVLGDDDIMCLIG